MANENHIADTGKKVRLIDAEAMREYWLYNGENEYVYDANAVLDSIDEQPSVDAVEVVRCKDCQFYQEGESYNNSFCRNANGLNGKVLLDYHCPHGLRKEGTNGTD